MLQYVENIILVLEILFIDSALLLFNFYTYEYCFWIKCSLILIEE